MIKDWRLRIDDWRFKSGQAYLRKPRRSYLNQLRRTLYSRWALIAYLRPNREKREKAKIISPRQASGGSPRARPPRFCTAGPPTFSTLESLCKPGKAYFRKPRRSFLDQPRGLHARDGRYSRFLFLPPSEKEESRSGASCRLRIK